MIQIVGEPFVVRKCIKWLKQHDITTYRIGTINETLDKILLVDEGSLAQLKDKFIDFVKALTKGEYEGSLFIRLIDPFVRLDENRES